MNVIIWVLAALAIAFIIFMCGPQLLQLPLFFIEVADIIRYLVSLQVERWKETIKMLREVLFGGDPD